MKKLSVRRLLALCLVFVLSVSSFPTVAFADTTATKMGRNVYVATAPNSLFSPKVKITNTTGYMILVQYTVTKGTNTKNTEVGKTYVVGYIGAGNTKTVSLPKGFDLNFWAGAIAPAQAVDIKVTAQSHIWNIWT